MPAGELANVPAALAARFVADFNASQYARDRKRVALLTDCGVIMLNSVPADDRPDAASGFTPATECDLTQNEARQAAQERNAEILKFASVPRVWNVILRHVGRELERAANPVA